MNRRTNCLIAIIVFRLLSVVSGFIPSVSDVHSSLVLSDGKSKVEGKSDNLLSDSSQVIDENRRLMFGNLVKLTAGCLCCSSCVSPHVAYGLSQLVSPNEESLKIYDVARNPITDEFFAQGMAVGMVDYEREASPKKKRLFSSLFSSLEGVDDPVVVEVGMGSFPNALYYKNQKGLDIIGIDPNDRMERFAKESATRAGIANKDSLRIFHGVSEALPLSDNSVDAIVCTLTLCSVLNPSKSIEEIKRVLKPGGKFLFWEHVLSETDENMAQYQISMTPQQVKRADGCHLDRRTGELIKAAKFKKLDLEYFELKNFSFLNPTVCGIATA